MNDDDDDCDEAEKGFFDPLKSLNGFVVEYDEYDAAFEAIAAANGFDVEFFLLFLLVLLSIVIIFTYVLAIGMRDAECAIWTVVFNN